MRLPFSIQVYFAQIQPVSACTADDGRLAGHLLMHAAHRAKKAQRKQAIATDVRRMEMLRHAPLANISTLLQWLISKETHRLLAGNVGTRDPAQLTAADAATIGEGITLIRRGHMVPERALLEIFSTYPVLRETAERCVWFESMLREVVIEMMGASTSSRHASHPPLPPTPGPPSPHARERAHTHTHTHARAHTHGCRLRLLLSTFLSLFDIGTDLYTALIYFLTDQPATGSLILAMVGLSVAAQLLIVFYRNKHRRWAAGLQPSATPAVPHSLQSHRAQFQSAAQLARDRKGAAHRFVVFQTGNRPTQVQPTWHYAALR